MKNISIILPVNNTQILCDDDLQKYQSDDLLLTLYYPKSDLLTLDSVDDAVELLPVIEQLITEVEYSRPSSILMAAFGDVCINRSGEYERIRKIGAGRISIRAMANLARQNFTILPLVQDHLSFIDALIFDERVENYIASPVALNMDAHDMRDKNKVLDRLFELSRIVIEDNDVDVLTVGSTSFIGIARDLEIMLKEFYNQDIKVIEPLKTAIEFEVYRMNQQVRVKKL